MRKPKVHGILVGVLALPMVLFQTLPSNLRRHHGRVGVKGRPDHQTPSITMKCLRSLMRSNQIGSHLLRGNHYIRRHLYPEGLRVRERRGGFSKAKYPLLISRPLWYPLENQVMNGDSKFLVLKAASYSMRVSVFACIRLLDYLYPDRL